MKKICLFLLLAVFTIFMQVETHAQTTNVMTPELLWKLGRVSFVAQSPDGNEIIYRVTHYTIENEKSSSKYYLYHLKKKSIKELDVLKEYDLVQWDKNGIYAIFSNALYVAKDFNSEFKLLRNGLDNAQNMQISPNGKWIVYAESVQLETIFGKEKYTDAKNSTAKIYDDLNFRHWDTYSDGKYNHIFLASLESPNSQAKDLLEGQKFHTPTQPFGGSEDYLFSPDSKYVIYVCKKKSGKEYAVSTNTDIYSYNIENGKTMNLSEGMMGYDLNPTFSPNGKYLSWLSMRRDGYEADKNDIVIMEFPNGNKINLTQEWDITVDGGYKWSNKSDKLYFNVAHRGTVQLFYTHIQSSKNNTDYTKHQLSSGNFDITGVLAEYDNNQLVISRTDFNTATELYNYDVTKKVFTPITQVNKSIYDNISLSKSELKIIKNTENKDLGIWVVYPPNFDSTKKYPTLLYCQGGPQGALSQFYSFRWNFQLMAAQGYIVVAPNRTGMPGWGVSWNEDISGDWGGQPMKDYLSAIDYMTTFSYVDKDRLGAIGASYGGYSVFMLAGIHEGRFKTFISHCGLFDMKSWYGTTEELWFANWDLKGTYWSQNPPKAYTEFNPSNYVQNWSAPILIFQGEKDYRVPIEQGLQAFQAAQLKGLKSKLILFPDENHWILKGHNALVWHREFFSWLKETL